jgi:hypothetical protein
VSARHRLPLAPAQPDRTRPVARAVDASLPSARIETNRVVIAVTGDDALVLGFVRELRSRAADRCVVIGPDSFVGGQEPQAVRERLNALPRDAWVIAVGEVAARRIAPTFTIGLGKRHAMASETTDLWLGQCSATVADSLIEALHTAI